MTNILIDNEDLIIIYKRREESLNCAIKKIYYIVDFLKIYKIKNRFEDMDNLIKYLKSKIKFAKSSNKDDARKFKYLELKCEKDEFLNKIQDILKNICDEISLKEVDDYRNSLLKYLKYAKEEKITGLKKGIADLSELMLFEKEKEMDDLLFYIHQTLLTSLIYSDKIKSGKLLSVG